jgi:hypothetical protein
MSITGPTVTQQNVFVAVRGFLQSLLPGVDVIQGQINRVPSPAADNYVVMWPLFQEALATNLQAYQSPDAGPLGTSSYLQATKVTLQLDVHGTASTDNAVLITTLWNSDYGVTAIQAQGYDIAPLYTSTPRQAPFTTGEQQWDDRWVIDAVLQTNPVTTVPQDFAIELEVTTGPPGAVGLTVGLIDVDVAYPPIAGSVGIVSCGATVSGRSF